MSGGEWWAAYAAIPPCSCLTGPCVCGRASAQCRTAWERTRSRGLRPSVHIVPPELLDVPNSLDPVAWAEYNQKTAATPLNSPPKDPK